VFKALNLWLGSYLRNRPLKLPEEGDIHILIAICDHFEPLHKADLQKALERCKIWKAKLPLITARFHDSDGIPPRHTFFYPIEQYKPQILDELKEICDKTGAETEVHLHHDSDTESSLEEKLTIGINNLRKHGFLSVDNIGKVRYGFIHGNWAIANSHPQRLFCGVDNEIDVLARTGCYADFTMPSAPNPTQSRVINSIYYIKNDGKPRPIDRGEVVCVKTRDNEHESGLKLLAVQGPLGLNWQWRKYGIFPRIENGDLTAANPPTPTRFNVWVRLHIHVVGRPEWIFIKLHTHGGIEKNFNMLLGDPMFRFHSFLKDFSVRNSRFKYHYVSAREMVNIIHAAEDGLVGNPHHYRNYRYKR